MAIKLKGISEEKEKSFIKINTEESSERKLFQNKAANKALIAAAIIITVTIIGAIIMVNISLPWHS